MFTPHFKPLPYQQAYLDEHATDESWGLFWDMGTGKTKALIDNVALLIERDAIDGCLVLAPNGVHREWAIKELPKHWPHDVSAAVTHTDRLDHAHAKAEPEPWVWDTSRASGKRYNEDFRRWLDYTRNAKSSSHYIGFLLMSYDGLMTDAGKQASWQFLKSRRAFYIADESQRFKTPAAKRQTRVFYSSAYAPYKRIASGTPMDKPFDIYSQMRFLDEDFWRKTLGIDSNTAFKHHFGNWYPAKLNTGVVVQMLNDKTPYKNLDVLEAVLKQYTTRITEEQAELHLPPRLYQRVYHDLSDDQRRVYEELKTDMLSFLDSGSVVTTDHVLTMRLRLMQIGAGFVAPSAGAQPEAFRENPRLDKLTAMLASPKLNDEPTLQWCQFVHDAASLAEASRSLGREPVIYDANDPVHTLDRWVNGEADDLIANLGSGLTEGFTLVRTAHVLYYTNTPRLITRQQSEKRAHRIGQTRPVTYYDFLARGTNDEANLEAVRQKAVWVGQTLGDDPARAAAWLRATLRVEPIILGMDTASPAERQPAQPSFWDGGSPDMDEYERSAT